MRNPIAKYTNYKSIALSKAMSSKVIIGLLQLDINDVTKAIYFSNKAFVIENSIFGCIF